MTSQGLHVLAAITDPQTAAPLLRTADEFARRHGARLSVLLVRERPEGLEKVAGFLDADAATLSDRLDREDRTALASLLESLELSTRPTAAVRTGLPFVEIIRSVLREEVDFVLKEIEPRGGRLGHVFASADQHLLRKCPVPVWLCDAAPRGLPQRILAAVDVGTDVAPEPATLEALNQEILACAERLASPERTEIHVVHVWDAPGLELLNRFADDSAAARYLDHVESERRRALEGLLAAPGPAVASSGRVEQHTRLVRGRPRTVLPELIQALGTELLILGTTARTGVPGVLIGNTAEDVLNSIDCGVLTVKPPGFRTPILAPSTPAEPARAPG